MKHNAAKAQHYRYLKWKGSYFEYNNYLDDFADFCKRQGKSSATAWKNRYNNFIYYCLTFFLEVKKEPNPVSWCLHHIDFLKWLENTYQVKNRDKKLAMQTQNNIIVSLNGWYKFLKEKRVIKSYETCPPIPKKKFKPLTSDVVILHEEYKKVKDKLREYDIENIRKENPRGEQIDFSKHQLIYSDAWSILWHGGMRVNELRSLSLDSFFTKKVDFYEHLIGKKNPFVQGEKIEFIPGYLIVKSQVSKIVQELRDENGNVKHITIKTSRKEEIDEKDIRTIPLISKDCFDVVVKAIKKQKLIYATRKYGNNKSNYVLFDFSPTTLWNNIQKAYKQLGLKPQRTHNLRHSCSTLLVGTIQDYFTARQWLGHKDIRTTDNYIHMAKFLNIAQNVSEIVESEDDILTWGQRKNLL